MEALSTPPNICVFVVGMHRSGTSAMTRVLNLLGAELPRNVLGPAASNPNGHWEPEPLVRLNEELLQASGSHWADWRRAPLVSPDGVELLRAKVRETLAAEYGTAGTIVLKDPRISRLVPFYASLVNDLGYDDRYLLAVRNPGAVSASLATRDRVGDAYAGLLWLRHQIDAERDTRGRPRVVVPFEQFLADWRSEMNRVEVALGLGLDRTLTADRDAQIDDFVDASQVNHWPTSTDRAASVSAWVDATYRAFQNLVADPNDPSSLAELDRVSAELDEIPATVSRALAEESFMRLREIDRIAAQASESEAIRTELESRVDEIKADRDELQLRHARLRAKHRATRAALAKSRSARAKLRQQRDAMQSSYSWRMTKPFRLMARLLRRVSGRRD